MRFAFLLTASALLLCRAANAQPVLPGDLFWVSTKTDGTGDVLARVNATTGAQTTITTSGWKAPKDSFWSNGNIFVVDADAGTSAKGAVIKVDPVSGAETIISQAGVFHNPGSIAVMPDGTIYVTDNERILSTPALIRVNPVTGAQQTILQGSSLYDPHGMAVESSGTLLVADQLLSRGTISRIDPVTGSVQVLSQSGLLEDPRSIALDIAGNIYVVDSEAGVNRFGAIIRIDAITGAQTMVSQGGLFRNPVDLGFDLNGQFIVADVSAATGGIDGALLRVDPVTGIQTRITNSTSGYHPITMTIVPTPEPTMAIWLSGWTFVMRRKN